LLAQSVVQDFAGKARFVVENYGDSQLAKRFGVTRYSVIFVNDVLIAKPKDFGYYGKGEGPDNGKYAPWVKNAESQQKFRADLSRMIGLILAGREGEARSAAVRATEREIGSLPAISLTDLAGKPLSREQLSGRPVLVEFWATWCPPCRGTLSWLGELKKRYGDRLAILAIAVESDEANVRKVVGELQIPFNVAMGTPEQARAFGDISAVPVLFLFDGSGRTVASYFGAPPDLHARAETKIASLLPS
jgi:thiol-disulfide isomerase/thioredoxin